METKAKHIFKSSQTCINTIACSDDFPIPATNTATSKNATAEPQQQQQKRNMRLSSSSSLGDGSACAMTHQYHYIQYPAYYQLMHERSAANHAAPQNMLPPTTCRCPCSCGNASSLGIPAASNFNAQHMHQHSDDSQMAVAVIVHQQETGVDGGGNSKNLVAKAKSEQSLLEHSYQALHTGCDDEKPLNLADTTSCDCDLECTCAVALPPKSKQCGGGGGAISALMLSADEITVSESDNNSTMVKRKSREVLVGNGTKKINTWIAHQDNIITSAMDRSSRKTNYNSSQIDIYSDGDGDGTDSCLKINNGSNSGDDLRPPLPPRPPPRPRNVLVNINAHRNGAGGIKKYVVWCLICGGFSCLLGVLFLGVYFLLHSYTITVGNFETVPTFVPATLLILTGLCIMSLARRRNRYSYLIKLSGACGLISALTCALVTVTTTVLHMSRLQALRECEYAQKTRTCTCYSDMIESQVERVDKGVRLVFDSLSDCGVVHGSLYSCLRAIFGLSVAGVLIAVFSCMLVYQLLSHERKKMYWEQLELRCRSLYTSQQGPPPPNMAAMSGGRANVCRCCEQCHAHRQVPLQPSAYPWDDGAEPRFWTGQPPGNFYSPNPGGEDLHNTSGGMPAGTCRGHGLSNSRSRATGWSWPRMPWQRSSPVASSRFRQTPSSPDSQYGFSNNVQTTTNSGEAVLTEEQVFNGVSGTSLPYGVWGPPPPYSDPNSPARRGYYQYLHHPNVTCVNVQPDRQTAVAGAEQHIQRTDCRAAHRTTFGLESQPNDSSVFCAQTTSMRSLSKRHAGIAFKATSSKGDYENTPSDSDGGARDHFSNTLPTRKIKKRVEAGAKSIGPNSQSTQRVNVQHVFSSTLCANEGNVASDLHSYHEPVATQNENFAATGCIAPRNCAAQSQVATQRHKNGVENTAFQSSAECSTNIVDGRTHIHMHELCDPTESEVYFADVSSCCNISVKNDNYYDEANQAQAGLGQTSTNSQNHHASNHNHHQHGSNNNSDEDYLAQRFGKRENSIRSRLPFPQTCNEDYDRNSNMIAANTNSNNMQKEISRQSMCSVESDTKTEFTDLSPSTPCSNSFTAPHGDSSQSNDIANTTAATRVATANTFVASFPYSSESQSLEAHRRSTRNISNEPQQMMTTEAQYEVINDAASCKPLNFPVVSSGRPVKGGQLQQRPTMLRTVGAANTKKSNRKDAALEKGQTAYQSDVEWSDGSNCTNDRQNL